MSILTLMLSLTFLVACGDDDDGDATGPDNSGDLTREESVEMLEALTVAGSFSIPGFGGAQASPSAAAAADPVNQDISVTSPCPEGGSILFSGNISGDVDQETGAADLDMTMSLDHSDCGASSEAGKSFVFNGNPDITTQVSMVTDANQSFSMTGTQTGGLSWTTEGKSGTCAFDLTYDFSGSGSTFSGSVSGTVCGYDVTQSVSF